MANEWEPNDVFDLLADDEVRTIMAVTEDEPQSAKQLYDHCESSLSAVYLRINAMVDYGLLREDVRISAEGNHHSVYESNCAKINVEPAPREIVAELELKDGRTRRITDELEGT